MKNQRQAFERPDAPLPGALAPLQSTRCPSCGAALVVRAGRNGPFVGCSGYAAGCRFTYSVPSADITSATSVLYDFLTEHGMLALLPSNAAVWLPHAFGVDGRLAAGSFALTCMVNGYIISTIGERADGRRRRGRTAAIEFTAYVTTVFRAQVASQTACCGFEVSDGALAGARHTERSAAIAGHYGLMEKYAREKPGWSLNPRDARAYGADDDDDPRAGTNDLDGLF